jgi:ubiquinone/menaquinone biosynthesis C-methylase UbiE
MRRGHRVVGVELSPLLASSASTHAEAQLTIVGSLESLPLADHCADLVTASMVLMDVDELDSSMAEIARILTPGGRFCFSVLHPLNTAGAFSDRDDPESSFVLSEPYFSPRRRSLTVERNGQKITFSHQHRTLARYFASLEGSGFVVDRLTEPVIGQALTSADPNWARRARMPNALHVSAMLD